MTIYNCVRCTRIIDTEKPGTGWRIDDIVEDSKPQVLCSVCAWDYPKQRQVVRTRCPYCGASAIMPLRFRLLLNGGVRLNTCDNCGGEYSAEMIEEERRVENK